MTMLQQTLLLHTSVNDRAHWMLCPLKGFVTVTFKTSSVDTAFFRRISLLRVAGSARTGGGGTGPCDGTMTLCCWLATAANTLRVSK